jgi:hypothetical protein
MGGEGGHTWPRDHDGSLVAGVRSGMGAGGPAAAFLRCEDDAVPARNEFSEQGFRVAGEERAVCIDKEHDCWLLLIVGYSRY